MKNINKRKRCNKKKSSISNNQSFKRGRSTLPRHIRNIAKKEPRIKNKTVVRRRVISSTITYRRCLKMSNNKSIVIIRDKNNKILRRINKTHKVIGRSYYYKKVTKSKKTNKYGVLKKKIISKLEKIIKSSKFKKASRGILFAFLSLISVDVIDKCNRDVFLNVHGQELTWSTSENINSSLYSYRLYRDNELLATTRGYKFIETLNIDKESPKKIGNIKVNDINGIIELSWKEPTDIGTKYVYKVEAVNNKTRKKYTSRRLNETLISGIDKYIVNVNGKEYQTYTTSFSIDTATLKNGKNNIEIMAIDLAGNKSEPKKIELKIDTTRFYLDGYKIATNNPEINNEQYDMYLVKEKLVKEDGKLVPKPQKMKISLGDNITGYFMNKTTPKLSNPRYTCENDMINIVWEETPFGSRSTDFYIECVNKKTLKKYTSNMMKYNNGDFLSGYYYNITTTPLYKVKSTDAYTMDSNVTLNYNEYDKDKIYYFHVAASDEYGNMSKTKTIEFDFKHFTSNGEIKDVIRKFLYKNTGVTGDDFRKITDDIYNALTYKTIKQIDSRGIKISLTSGSAKDFIKKHHTIKPLNDNAQYIKEDATIVYNVNSSLEYLIKELVKVFDEIPKSPWSKNIDFLKVYNEERKSINEGNINAQDYLSEALWLYISMDDSFEYNMPKTYEFVKRFYKNIMLG